ncbi:MAG TPA: alkaline phosphatase D family protein [Pseudonocardiaceae bacterium]
MPELVLGPLLRYVDQDCATVWVETDAPCVVRVLDAEARTFTVHGHHYAFVDVTGLTPGSSTPYDVRLDGERVWPEPDSPYPPSRIRTLDPARRLRLAFGSCRTSVPHDDVHNATHGLDILRAVGNRLTTLPEDEWPDAMLMLGDQVYADEPSAPMLEYLRSRRAPGEEPVDELADFEEYTRLYRFAWTDPTNRWLLSTLPTMMIFDDHDIRDDWNTSDVWRAQMARLPWWHRRVVGGLGSYWIYQHAGNMSVAERRDDPLMKALCEADGDGGAILDEFAAAADAYPERNRWSYARDIGGVRIVVLDSRCGRVLTSGRRTVLDEAEWNWFVEQARGRELDHLLIGTSLPYLLPRGLHELEYWNEAVADGHWGRPGRRIGEWIRQKLDLEHWAAFHDSFDKMADVLREVGTGERAPATVVLLSGDVHYSYLMRATVPDADQRSRIYQAVCSPIRNPLPRLFRYANTLASFAVAGVVGRLLARTAGLHEQALQWHLAHRPMFDNAIAQLDLDGREAALRWETAVLEDGAELPTVTAVAEVDLMRS